MQGDLIHKRRVLSLDAFIYLAGSGFLIAGSTSAMIAAAMHFESSAIVSGLIALAGGLCLGIPPVLRRNPARIEHLVATLRSRAAQLAPSAAVLICSTVLFLTAPGARLIMAMSAVLLWSWIFGVATLLFFRPESPIAPRPATQTPIRARPYVAFVGLLLVYGIAAVPSRIPGLLDGIPWDTPAEFLFVGLLLPLAFLFGQRTFGERIVLVSLGALLLAKIAATILLPQAGLGIRAYSSETSMSIARWERSYYSLLAPSYTQVTQAPFSSYREFPIEWINSPGFRPESFWAGLDISGVARLENDEKLVFLVQGFRTAQIAIVEQTHQTVIPALVVSSLHDLNSEVYRQLPQLAQVKFQGTLVFKKLGQLRLEPLVLYPNGSFRSALLDSRIWVDPAGSTYSSTTATALQYLISFIGLLCIGIVCIAFLVGVLDRFRMRQLTHLDLYLAASGVLALFIAGLVPNPQMNLVMLALVGLLGSAKIAEAAIYPHEQSIRGFLFSIGIAFLLIFAALELHSLRSVVIFPQGQDGLEYQYLARRIFVSGDTFLLQTPPRAYKILFPYVVGALHSVFGQSASGQLFLNAWSGLLSSMIVVRLMKTIVPATLSFGTAILFLLILCLPSTYVYYFRFGLIEPIAVLLLLITCYFSSRRNLLGMFGAGLLTVLLRLDYLGAAFGAIVLTAPPIAGGSLAAWRLILARIRAEWRLATAYGLFLCIPPALIILGYTLLTSKYALNALDTHQTSLASVADGLLRIIAGGNLSELRSKAVQDPSYLLLMALPLVLGFAIASASLLWRQGVFSRIDLRLALLAPAILPTYLLVRPTGYLPRFSFSVLPFDLMLIASFVFLLRSQPRSVKQ